MATKAPLDHLMSRKKRVYKRVPIAMDSQLLENRDKAKSAVQMLDAQLRLVPNRSDKLNDAARDELDEAKLELTEAEQALADDVEWFQVESIGPKAFDKLTSKHPPTPEQRREAKKDGEGALLFNPDTFYDALLPLSASYVFVDPDDDDAEEELVPLTPEFIQEMRDGDNWAHGDFFELVQAALEVNQGMRRVGDLGNASRRTRRSG